ncbi:MAG: ABC transporter permease [Lacrimispora sp.]|uniref:ABC transporter permease n=1 Tax=Lacrimispora sp. TaxID=2719234 RepID=UPI0039E5B252
MKSFRKNVFRCAMQNPGSFLGAVFIIAIGIFVYAAMMDTLRNLRDQVERYYENSSMADVFAQVSGISEVELERLKEIPGIAAVSGKMGADVRLLAPSQTDIVTVHLLSYDSSDALNQLLFKGIEAGEDGIYLGTRMAGIYQYETGTPLTLLIDGKSVKMELAGSCYGPEYIYAIPPGGAMIPDGKIYDIACMEKSRMEELTGKRDSLNELGFKLEKGYQYEDVRYQLTDRLQGYGLISLSSRENQASYQMVDGEISELYSMGTVLPVLFMSISVFMLYVVLRKMIDRDQSLIGTMKAFGMSDGELITAYLYQGAEVGLLGAILGNVLAAPFGRYMFQIYVGIFNLPNTVYQSYWSTRLGSTAMALATGFFAVYLGVRGILKINPAQAMRAKTPASAATLRLPRFLAERLDSMGKMGVRSIVRNPFRGFLIVLAIGFPFSMSSVLFSFEGVANQMFFDQFSKVQTYDLQISLDRYVSPVRGETAGEGLNGVAKSEAVIHMAAELKHENLSEFAMVYGLNRGSDMWRIMDLYGQYHEPPDDGMIINSRIAGKLHLKEGDLMEISVPGLTAERVKVPVKSVIKESLGSGCYISARGFYRFFNSHPMAGTVLLKVENGKMEEVREQLLKTSRVTWMVDTDRIRSGYQDMMGSMMAMIQMFAFMSVAAGGILIYNISMINIRERITELGTLVIMGGTDREIGRILLFEQAVYFVFGIFMGILGSRGVKYLIEHLVVSDTYTIDLAISSSSYVTAFLTCLAMAGVSLLAQTRFVKKIRLTDILKERE